MFSYVICKAAAAAILHGIMQHAIHFSEVVKPGNVWMRQFRDGSRLC
jgi:hypothetical protein